MGLTHEYIHHHAGYRFGVRCCWVHIYKGDVGDAPVVVCTEPTEIGGAINLAEMSKYLAAEVVQERSADGLPDLSRPLLWIERRLARRRYGPDKYFLVSFSCYRSRPEGIGFVRRPTLGSPGRELLSANEVANVTGEGAG
jgi:hypothetical protein